jgi:hypothetical protein
LWRDGRRAITITRLQLLVPLELGWQRASRGARRSIWDLRASDIRHPRAVAVAVAGGLSAVGRAWTTWLSGPASDGRRQCLVNDSSAHWQCVVEKQGLYIYILQLRGKLQKRAIFVKRRMHGRTNERTKGFSVGKALVEIGSQLCCSSHRNLLDASQLQNHVLREQNCQSQWMANQIYKQGRRGITSSQQAQQVPLCFRTHQ